MTRKERIAELAAVVGNDGTDNLGVIVDHADPSATTEELAEIVISAREEWVAERLAQTATAVQS